MDRPGDLLARRVRRRDFMRYAGLAGVTGILAACRRAPAPGTGSGGGTAPPPIEQEPGNLHIFDWAGYEVEPLWKPYAKAFPDAQPTWTVFKDDDSSFAKVAAGARFDVAHPCGYRFRDWVDLGVLQPWDTALIPSFADLNPSLQAAGSFDGQQYFVVTDWGFAAPMYNADEVRPSEDSWGLLWDERYGGKISWWDSLNMFVVAGYYHGVENPWDMTDDELDEMKRFLIDKIDLVRFLWVGTEVDEAFAAGDIWIAYAWPASWAIAKGNGVNAVYMDPKEGRTSWYCGFCLFADTPNYHHAHAYVDAWASARSGLWLINNYYYGHTNTGVDLSKVDPTLIEAFSLDDPSILEEPRTHVERPIPRRELYNQLWEEVKAAA